MSPVPGRAWRLGASALLAALFLLAPVPGARAEEAGQGAAPSAASEEQSAAQALPFGDPGASAPPAAPAAVQSPARLSNPAPMYWVIEAGEAKVHIFGTIHLGRPELADPPPEALAAFDAADRLVAEISSKEMSNAGLASLALVFRSRLPAGKAIADYLSRHDVAALKRALGKKGYSTYENYEPWIISLALSAQALAKAGYDERYGLDRRLYARAAGRPVEGLDTVAGQLALLDSGSLEEQAAALSLVIRDFLSGDTERESRELLSAYEAGDGETLSRILDDSRAESLKGGADGGAFERVFADRNRAWAGKIAGFLAQGGSWFIFAGSGHFFGGGSVFAELAALGVL